MPFILPSRAPPAFCPCPTSTPARVNAVRLENDYDIDVYASYFYVVLGNCCMAGNVLEKFGKNAFPSPWRAVIGHAERGRAADAEYRKKMGVPVLVFEL